MRYVSLLLVGLLWCSLLAGVREGNDEAWTLDLPACHAGPGCQRRIRISVCRRVASPPFRIAGGWSMAFPFVHCLVPCFASGFVKRIIRPAGALDAIRYPTNPTPNLAHEHHSTTWGRSGPGCGAKRRFSSKRGPLHEFGQTSRSFETGPRSEGLLWLISACSFPLNWGRRVSCLEQTPKPVLRALPARHSASPESEYTGSRSAKRSGLRSEKA
jgi:hypothetical protein